MNLCLILLTTLEVKVFIKQWWALLIVVPCFIDFFRSKRKIFNVIGFLIGLGILLRCLGH